VKKALGTAAMGALAIGQAVAADVPAILLKYQVTGVELADEHEFLAIEKSRRTGITYGFAARAVIRGAPAVGGRNTYYIGYNLDMAREFIGYAGDFARAFDEIAETSDEFLFDDGSEKGIKALRIDFPSGNSIVALSSRPRSLRGMQGDVIIDEAAFHDDLVELHKAAMALTMWGGHVVMISTHDGADNAFNVMIEDIRSGKLEGHVITLTLADALKDGLFKRICLRAGQEWSLEAERKWEASLRKRYGDAAEEELDVIPSAGSGTYLSRATIKAAMSSEFPVLRLTCPDGFERRDQEEREEFILEWLHENIAPLLDLFDPNSPSYFGQDFARSIDLAAVTFGQRGANSGDLLARFILEMRNVPFTSQHFLLKWIIDRLPRFAAGKMDARGNGQMIAEMLQQDYGFEVIEAVMASEKTYLAFMPKLKSAIEDRSITIPEDEGTLEDLRCIKKVKGVPKIIDRRDDKTDGAKGKRHGDNAISLMHFVAAADEDFVDIPDAQGTGARETSGDMETTDYGFGTIRRAADDFTLGAY
jgi:phage FluMu gp28-like protein